MCVCFGIEMRTKEVNTDELRPLRDRCDLYLDASLSNKIEIALVDMPVLSLPLELDHENRPLWWKRQLALPAPFQTPIPVAPADDPPGPIPASTIVTTSPRTGPTATTLPTTARTTVPTSILPARPTTAGDSRSGSTVTSSSTTPITSRTSSTTKTTPASTRTRTASGSHSYICQSTQANLARSDEQSPIPFPLISPYRLSSQLTNRQVEGVMPFSETMN